LGIIGGLLKVTGMVAGKVVEYGIKATGEVIGFVAEVTDNDEFAKGTRDFTKGAGEFLGKGIEVVGEGTGYVIDKTIEISAKAGAEVVGFVAEVCDADEKQVKTAKVIGAVIGGGAIGLFTGDLIGSALSSVTAATGVASTGTAIATLHGAAATNATLAALGGGALSAGGGGIAAGQALLTGINVAGTVAGSVDGAVNKRQ
jgi:hypothetical protein